MPGRFDDAALEAFAINPRRPSAWATCPCCGGQLVMGYRKDTGSLSLAHDTLPDPAHPGVHLAGCAPFREIAARNVVEFLRICQSRGVRWQKLVG